MLSSNMLLPNLIPLIDVTFSTPTGHSAQNPCARHFEWYGDVSSVDRKYGSARSPGVSACLTACTPSAGGGSTRTEPIWTSHFRM